jgi:hypothetical protein
VHSRGRSNLLSVWARLLDLPNSCVEERPSQEHVFSLGRPDDQVHVLSLVVDVADQMGAELEEMYEGPDGVSLSNANNRLEMDVVFCGWNPVLTAGDGAMVGEQTAGWDTVTCLMDDAVHHDVQVCVDKDIPMEGDMVDESAWQECSGYNVSALRAVEYLEQNIGEALANATANPTHTWTNHIYYDGTLVAVNDSRAALAMGSARQVAGLPSGLAIPQLIDDELGFDKSAWTHNLTVVLDVYDEVSFALQFAWTFTAQLRFCTRAQLAFSGGACGCTGELQAAPMLQLGTHTLGWGESVCLGEADMRFYDEHGYVASFRFVFTETNNHTESLREVAANYRNQILWDGVVLMTSAPMAALDAGSTRRVSWPGGAWLPRDGLEHNLTVVLNSATADLNLTEGEAWTRAREAYYDNNAYTVMVSFCDRKADITLGELASVGQGTAVAPWGGSVCLHESDVSSSVVELGPYLGQPTLTAYGLSLAYAEHNEGLEQAAGGWTVKIYWDDMETPVIVDANRPALGARATRYVQHVWTPATSQRLDLFAAAPMDDRRHLLRFEVDSEDVVVERHDGRAKNTYEVRDTRGRTAKPETKHQPNHNETGFQRQSLGGEMTSPYSRYRRCMCTSTTTVLVSAPSTSLRRKRPALPHPRRFLPSLRRTSHRRPHRSRRRLSRRLRRLRRRESRRRRHRRRHRRRRLPCRHHRRRSRWWCPADRRMWDPGQWRGARPAAYDSTSSSTTPPRAPTPRGWVSRWGTSRPTSAWAPPSEHT